MRWIDARENGLHKRIMIVDFYDYVELLSKAVYEASLSLSLVSSTSDLHRHDSARQNEENTFLRPSDAGP